MKKGCSLFLILWHKPHIYSLQFTVSPNHNNNERNEYQEASHSHLKSTNQIAYELYMQRNKIKAAKRSSNKPRRPQIIQLAQPKLGSSIPKRTNHSIVVWSINNIRHYKFHAISIIIPPYMNSKQRKYTCVLHHLSWERSKANLHPQPN